MAQKFPRDRFDSIPHGIERVGAHRAPARRGARWIAFGWAALAPVVLAVAGIAAVAVFNDRLNFDDAGGPPPPASPVATVPPTIVSSAFVSRMAMGATARMSWDSTARSASLPTSMDPRSRSTPIVTALLMV